MADNFAAFIIHRQSAPESRDWLAKLMGTTALWQSTDQTSAHAATGAGSRRRVREFRVGSDTFSELRVGEAVIHTTLGPPPAFCQIRPVPLPPGNSPRRIAGGERSPCEINVYPAAQLPAAGHPTPQATVLLRSDEPSAVAAPAPNATDQNHTAHGDHDRGEVASRQRGEPPRTFDDA
ncbi:MAG: hypothetical protein QOI48_2437 [Solirubrobacteraceae bacterium]|jgi:hypothetical protein|nr:hypothetical protein [Solirubrobacteraceae bacterium]